MSENDIIIRFAVRDDVDRIMKAIKNHWDANHILALNKDFFLYTFAGDGNQINMVIADEQSTGEIVGFFGFVQFSSNDIATGLWRALDDKSAFLGLKLFSFLIKNVNPQLMFGLGVNPKTAQPILQKLKYSIGKLNHFYRLADRSEYKIAKVVNKKILPVTYSKWEILLLSDFDIFKTKIDSALLKLNHPYKDMEYFRHRFFNHPIYHYMVYAITTNDRADIPAFFVCREVKKFETKILRIVDYIGDEKYFAAISFSLQELINKNNYEYIDCYSFGMSIATMNDAGFIQQEDGDENIIPNYFEPFLCQNVDIIYYAKLLEKSRFFRADIDQDQPHLGDRSLCE